MLKAVLVVASLAIAAGGASERAASRVGNGKIAFVRGSQLWVVNPDGSHRLALTAAKRDVSVGSISWSPDGSHLIFVREDDGCGGLPCVDWHLVRSDGTGLKSLNIDPYGGTPEWSPDGAHLAYPVSDGLAQSPTYALTVVLAVTDLHTGRTRQLAPALAANHDLYHGYAVEDIAWSPDGMWLCFSRAKPFQEGTPSRFLPYLVSADGQSFVKLAESVGFACNWSPDRSRIVFTNGHNIFGVNADGTGLVALTSQSERELAPTWSPDGTLIEFLRQEHGAKRAPYDLWIMAPDGAAQAMVATNVSVASWSPDGTLIAFVKGGVPDEATQYKHEPRRAGLWLTRSDGSAQIELAKGASEFAWQRSP